MKKFLLVITGLLFIMASCKKDMVSHQTELNTSLNTWNAYKASVNNSYSYVAYGGSVFGFYNETKITVQNGKVVGRDYISGSYPPNSSKLQINDTWSETSTQLNSHQQGAALLTIDNIYVKARKEWLNVDKEQNEIYFEAGNDGIISSCGYVPKGCQDDCFRGISIKSITRL